MDPGSHLMEGVKSANCNFVASESGRVRRELGEYTIASWNIRSAAPVPDSGTVQRSGSNRRPCGLWMVLTNREAWGGDLVSSLTSSERRWRNRFLS